jgi:hypothetical protein
LNERRSGRHLLPFFSLYYLIEWMVDGHLSLLFECMMEGPPSIEVAFV